MENDHARYIFKDAFMQLLFVYCIFMIAIALGFFSRYSLYFNLFALIIAFIGLYTINFQYSGNSEQIFRKNIHYFLLALSILYILTFRLMPYIYNNYKIPLGYDSGIYKYAIEHGVNNLDYWIRAGVEPGFLYTMTFLNSNLHISSQFLLTYGFIFCILGLGLSLYYFTNTYFKNKDIAVLSILIYSISLVQFKVFTYLYYKNIIALAFTLLAFTFLKKNKLWLFTLFGILTGIFHRPSFYIFGVSFFVYAIISPCKNSGRNYDAKLLFKYILHGSIIVAVSMLFFIDAFSPAITNLISPVVTSFVQTGSSPGTFIDFFDYQFSILFYLPLAIIGFLLYLKQTKKEFYKDVFFYYTLFLILIVYFQLFFFNRFIIFLDITLIVYSAYGSYMIIKSYKLGWIIVALLLFSGIILTFNASLNAKPTIPESIFNSIQSINLDDGKDNYIISISSEFTPYLQGFIQSSSNTKIIAPGMFDYDIWSSRQRWELFWQDLNATDLQENYGKDASIYLFYPRQINNSCYKSIENQLNLYLWSC